MSAYSVSGVGQGSADKAGQRGSEHLFVGVEKLIGTRIVYADTFSLTNTTVAVTFSSALPGANTDYIVLCTAAHNAYATVLTTNGFTMNGTTADTVSYSVIRVTNATVTHT
jgi:hypothetical protein